MESVINFLADYYIWFFVAAGVLCFALIGFLIESKKKNKNTFKGESIESSTTSPVEPVVSGNTVDMNGETTLSEATQSLTEENKETSGPVEVPNEPLETSAEPSEIVEDTMEINDIPLKEEEKTPIQFYSEPTEIPKTEPVVQETPVEPQQVNSTVFNDTPVMEIPIEETKPASNQTVSEPVMPSVEPTETKSEIETLNIFDDIK